MAIYLIGSLRNPEVPRLGNILRTAGHEVFDDWFGAGPEADDYWKKHETQRGVSYYEALHGYAAGNVFAFDKTHLDRCSHVVLVMPAGKSGHLELGYAIGSGKRGYVAFDGGVPKALPQDWYWLTGIYEGEGSLSRNGKKNGHGLQLTVTMKDKDTIDRLRSVSGVGSIEGPYKRDNPNWSDMYRWSVRKREDVFHCIKGMWDNLGLRRKSQIESTIIAAGSTITEVLDREGPYEARWDIMYRFAIESGGDVCFSYDQLVEKLND